MGSTEQDVIGLDRRYGMKEDAMGLVGMERDEIVQDKTRRYRTTWGEAIQLKTAALRSTSVSCFIYEVVQIYTHN